MISVLFDSKQINVDFFLAMCGDKLRFQRMIYTFARDFPFFIIYATQIISNKYSIITKKLYFSVDSLV